MRIKPIKQDDHPIDLQGIRLMDIIDALPPEQRNNPEYTAFTCEEHDNLKAILLYLVLKVQQAPTYNLEEE